MEEKAHTSLTKFRKNPKLWLSVLVIFSTTIMFWNLWSGSLYPWDEGWYGEVAREIVEDDLGWLTLHYNGEPWFHKPPLFIWAIAGTFKVLGVNEFSVRFWSALSGVGSVVLLYIISLRLFRSGSVAFLSAIFLISFNHFVRQSRRGMMDVPLTFLTLLGVLFLIVGRQRPPFLFLIGPVLAVAFMVKGFASAILLFSIALFALTSGERRLLAHPALLLGLAVGVVLCLPWHFQQYLEHGRVFLHEYFLEHVIRRSVETFPGASPKGVLYYFNVIVDENKPIGLASLVLLPYFAVRAVREKESERKTGQLLAFSGILCIFALFAFAKTKLNWYIVPVYPFLSLSAATVLYDIGARFPITWRKLFPVVVALLLLGPLARFAHSERHRTLDYKPKLKEISLSLREHSRNDDVVLFYEIRDEPVALFYAGRRAVKVSRHELIRALRSSRPIICLMSKDDDLYREVMEIAGTKAFFVQNSDYMLFSNVRRI